MQLSHQIPLLKSYVQCRLPSSPQTALVPYKALLNPTPCVKTTSRLLANSSCRDPPSSAKYCSSWEGQSHSCVQAGSPIISFYSLSLQASLLLHPHRFSSVTTFLSQVLISSARLQLSATPTESQGSGCNLLGSSTSTNRGALLTPYSVCSG